MNIFILSLDPQECARMLVDKHVGSKNTGGKMIVESTQMLANCYDLDRLAKIDCPRTKTNNIRTHSYYNNSCSKWVRKSLTNFNWLLDNALEMVQEKIYRGGNYHFCDTFLQWAKLNIPDIPDIGFTKPALAMPDEYKDDDPVVAYRRYYNEYKRHVMNMKWTRREPPEWWTNYDVNSKTKSN